MTYILTFVSGTSVLAINLVHFTGPASNDAGLFLAFFLERCIIHYGLALIRAATEIICYFRLHESPHTNKYSIFKPMFKVQFKYR